MPELIRKSRVLRPLRDAACARLPMLLSATLIVAPCASAYAQWHVESPSPTHLRVNGIAAPAAGRLFVATEDDSFDAGGALFESSDDGGTWTQRAVPANLHDGLDGVRFLDAQRGWAWGNRNYRTTDGGTTWVEMPFLGSTYFMEFSTPAFGVATGNFGAYVSRDGGVSWTPSPHDLVRFAFASDQIGLGVGPGGVHRTTDGGKTFASSRSGVGEAVAFVSPVVAVAIVDDTLLRSTDAGQTWNPIASAQGRDRLFVASSGVVLASGRSGSGPDYDERLLRSADAGTTWSDLGEAIPSAPSAGPIEFAAPDATTLVASNGAGSLYRSTDAGQSWSRVFASPVTVPPLLDVGAPQFTDAQTGYFGFGAGLVLRTLDGGATWSPISSGIGSAVTALDRFANGALVAVTASGEVLTRAADSPQWIARARVAANGLAAVQVVGPTSAVAVDRDGALYRSSDAGASWSTASAAPPDVVVADLHFTSLDAGWVVGQGFEGAALFRTVDAGATWSPVTDFQGTYVAVDFEGASGWAVASYGTLQRTTDAGQSWAAVELPQAPASIGDVDFWDAEVGYAVGTSGYAARSADGGQTWQILPTPNASDAITDIELIGRNELWISTAGGIAMYSATGGQNWFVTDAGSASLGSYAALAASPDGDAWIAGYRGAIRRFDGPPGPPVNRPPTAAFEFSVTGLALTLTDASTDADGTISSWSWDFGDGTTSTERNPSHVFDGADTYHVSLTVTDDDGDSDATLRFIVVQPGPGGTWGDFVEVTPLDALFVTPQDEDFWVSSAAPADYDGDGDLDIAVLGYYVVYNQSVVDRLVVLRNDGAASPTQWNFAHIDVPLGALSSGASDLAWGDADGDGDPDLVVGSDGATVLYRNDAGTLVATATELPGYLEDNDQADFDLQSIAWADFDNDGDLDLLLPSVRDGNDFQSRTALLRNDGADGSGGRVFTDVAAGLGISDHAQTRWADFDGDQDLDLLVVHLAPLTEEGFIRRYRNDGNGVFVGEDILGSLSVEHGEAQWGDYDDDGDLDILVAGNIRETDGSYDTVLRVYRNEAGNHVPFDVIACVFCEGWFDLSAATWADYDSDGDFDILLAGTYNSGSQIEGRAKVYDNVDGAFVDSGNALPAPRAMGFSGGSFTWLDIDGEGDLDYFIAGSYFVPGGNGLVETQMHLYVNSAPGQNLRPTAPSSPVASVEGAGTVSLRWDAASDDLTPPLALTYEVSVYRDEGSIPASRRLPEPGGLRGATEWLLTGLEGGSYRWTVEAVDSAYNGSARAEGVFTVVGAPPAAVFRNGFESP